MIAQLFVLAALFSAGSCWERVRDERMATVELRVVNEGLAHDDDHWYITNKHFIYKTSISPIVIQEKNMDAVTEDLRKLGYNHVGDIDILDGIIYGGIEGDGNALMASWNTSDLQMIKYVESSFRGLPWVAIEPNTRELYSAQWNDPHNIQVFDGDTFEFKRNLYIGNDTTTLPGEIQGGAFFEGELYVCSNAEDGVWKINLDTLNMEFVLSDEYKNHEYEMEGIDFFDLTDRGLGVMHLYGNFMQLKEKALHNYKP